MPNSSIKDEDRYQALRREGMSKSKAARIANTPPEDMDRSHMGQSYETWSKKQLMDKAREVGVRGRSKMTKAQLVDALRKG